jgi:hypothetical protein
MHLMHASADAQAKPCNLAGDVIDFVGFCANLVSGNVIVLLMHLMRSRCISRASAAVASVTRNSSRP